MLCPYGAIGRRLHEPRQCEAGTLRSGLVVVVVSENRMSAVDELLSWMAARGCDTSKLLWPFTTDSGRSVGCAVDGAAANEVLRVPGRLIFSAERAKTLLAPLLRSAPKKLRALADDSDELLLATTILVIVGSDAVAPPSGSADGAALSAVADFLPYARALPTFTDFEDIASQWEPMGELSLLCSSEAEEAAAQRRKELRDEFALLLSAVDAATASSTSGSLLWHCLSAALSWRNYLWARFCVQSRAFISGLDADPLFMCEGTRDMLPLAVVPLGDMFNHACQPVAPEVAALVDGVAAGAGSPAASGPDASEVEAAATTTTTPPHTQQPPLLCDNEWVSPTDDAEARAAGGFYILRLQEAAAPGRELCISYGDRGGLDLLESYGFFVPFPHNAHETLNADISFLLAAGGVNAADAGGSGSAGEAKAPASGSSACGASPLRASVRAAADRLLRHAATPATSAHSAAKHVTSLWEQLCSPTVVELPCAEAPSTDALMLLRLLAVSPADVEAASASAPSSRQARSGGLTLERLEHPLSRDNELRALACLQLAVLWAVAPFLERHSACRAADSARDGKAVLPATLSDQVSLLREVLVAERSLQATLTGQFAATATDASSSADRVGACSPCIPWPDAVPCSRTLCIPAESPAGAAAACASGSASTAPTAQQARRQRVASQFREAQLAVGILQLLYVQKMLGIAGVAEAALG